MVVMGGGVEGEGEGEGEGEEVPLELVPPDSFLSSFSFPGGTWFC